MLTLSNAPIKRKMILIGMLTSCVALLFTCGAFVVYEQHSSRNDLVKQNLDTATLVGYNNTAALTFNDKDSATASLRALKNETAITAAAIYDRDGKLFAVYRGIDPTGAVKLPSVEHDTQRFDDAGLSLFSDIVLDGETIGTVYIRHDLSETRATQRHYVTIAAWVMLVALLINWLISARLYRIISGPISQLSAVMGIVTADKNYSVRAVKHSADELGELIDGFNEMLQQIQQRESALNEAHGELEKRVAERTHELANSLSLLNATIESSGDGIIARQFNGKTICHNSRYQRLWNVPDAVMRDSHNINTRIEWISTQGKDSQHYLAQVEYRMAHPETDGFDVIELRDGRTIERYIRPQIVDGRQVGVVINFRDITARKQAERELEDIHKRLVETSRQAGMAEVATGVLHNVGNVLNSVNVSANLVTESIKGSKVAGLAKVAALLQEHRHDLSEFISHDAKGKHLPPYLVQLCEHLQTEQHLAVKELDTLRSNIDHIKQIVSMQQSFAKVSGVKELVNVIDLLEDTLRMNSGALQRHGVTIIRQFDSVPLINTEKHKILQILVNLVRNAKYACSESGRGDKCMTLCVTSNDTHIQIAAIDNGIGIAPENLTRIFSHGFTTRKDGHGFGLHSGALTARELGGSLQAHSAGVGHGATFILELPLDTTEEPKCLPA